MRTGNRLIKIRELMKIRAMIDVVIRAIMRSAMTARKINTGGKRRQLRRLTWSSGCATCRRKIVSGWRRTNKDYAIFHRSNSRTFAIARAFGSR
jgi:hypothetical protein